MLLKRWIFINLSFILSIPCLFSLKLCFLIVYEVTVTNKGKYI